MTTTRDLTAGPGTTYRFVVLDLPLDAAVEALASLATRQAGIAAPLPGAPGFHLAWPRRPRLARSVPAGRSTGWQLLPTVAVHSTLRLATAITSVELLPWDGRRTELALRLERRWLLSPERYDRVAMAALATIGAELSEERVLQPA